MTRKLYGSYVSGSLVV